MNKHIKLLSRLSKIIDLEKYFYTIRFYPREIQFQGAKNDTLSALLLEKGFEFNKEDDYDSFKKGDIEITLT